MAETKRGGSEDEVGVRREGWFRKGREGGGGKKREEGGETAFTTSEMDKGWGRGEGEGEREGRRLDSFWGEHIKHGGVGEEERPVGEAG